jgi:uncharacterized membrane protein YfcA
LPRLAGAVSINPMTPDTLWILTAAVFAVAVLYSAVGHAGASGYIAVMSLLSVVPAEIKPIALALNILVASIGTFQFWRAGHFSWPLFWPFALLSVPLAFVGGYLNLPTHIFKILVGVVLLLSAIQFLVRPPAESEPRRPPRLVALSAGGLLGLLSGLTATGGGIFLTPLLIFMRWARTRTAAAVSAPFILLNSVSGLAGNFSATKAFPAFAWALVIAVVIGGTIGSWFGSQRLPHLTIKRLLAVVLTIAGFKLILT